MIVGDLTVKIHPGAEPWAPSASWWSAVAPGLLGPQTVSLHPRRTRNAVWAQDHKGRPAPGGPTSFRAYTLGAVTRVFVDDTETPASIEWLILHELAHATINRMPTVSTPLRLFPRPARYATDDDAHEAVAEEQVCNRVANLLAPRLGGQSGLDRHWWRART
jgi:hypothetical protein